MASHDSERSFPHSSRLPRRGFLQVGALGMLGLSLSDYFALRARAQGVTPRARSVIHVWLAGGPSHLDTFDPKPEAGEAYCGPLKSPAATKVPTTRISELLPKLAVQADKYTLLRGITHPDFGHETATYSVLTGMTPSPDLVYPSMGSVVALKRTESGAYNGPLPPYITLTNPLGRFSDAGFLGNRWRSVPTFGDPNSKDFQVQGLTPPGGIPAPRMSERRELQSALDGMARRAEREGLVQQLGTYQQKAYDVIMGDARKSFDLSLEKDDLRDRYGRHTFGQSCLLARRLVEAGVPFITINYGGWDTHTDNFGAMKNLNGMLDSGLATLLEDLAGRGLLDTTMVVCFGEFGRTPKVDPAPPWYGGRHHYPLAYSALVAGGGFHNGAVVGATDATGEHVKERPVYPWDLVASMYRLLGIDPNERLPHPQGCVAYVSAIASGSVPTGGLLNEIMDSGTAAPASSPKA